MLAVTVVVPIDDNEKLQQVCFLTVDISNCLHSMGLWKDRQVFSHETFSCPETKNNLFVKIRSNYNIL